MGVRQQAYKECWQWLDAEDPDHPEPQPMEGLHPLAVEEWWIGYDVACKDYEAEEESIDEWADLVVDLIKSCGLLTVLGITCWIDNPWLSLVTGVLGFIYMMRKL